MATQSSIGLLELPGELRNRVYKLLFVAKRPINYTCGNWKAATGLLRVNRAIHHEATSILYASNSFDLTMTKRWEHRAWLRKIGPSSAALIRHVYIDFPRARCLSTGEIGLFTDDFCLLERLRIDCTSLAIITTSPASTRRMESTIRMTNYPEFASEILSLVHLWFDAFPSSPQIIVKVDAKRDGDRDVRETMRGYGWTVEPVFCTRVGLENFDVANSDDASDSNYSGVSDDSYNFNDTDDSDASNDSEDSNDSEHFYYSHDTDDSDDYFDPEDSSDYDPTTTSTTVWEPLEDEDDWP